MTVAIATVRCPMCRQSVAWRRNSFRPFCSERCRLRDLGNWVDERYRIPGAAADLEPGDDEGGENDAR